MTLVDFAWSARYKEGLIDLVQNHMKRMSSYLWVGTLHQNLFETSTGVDRYYSKNELDMTVAEWLAELLKGNELHLGTQ